MPDNEVDLMEWQLGAQVDFATRINPTAKLMVIDGGEVTPGIEMSEVEEQRGTLTPSYNATVDKNSGAAKISGSANYEQLGYFLDSLLGTATPSGTGGYVRLYTGPGTKPVSKIFTLVKGSAAGTYSCRGAIVNELSLKTETNKRLKFDASLIGHSVASDTLASPAFVDTVVNFLHANQMQLYIDPWSGTIGATLFTPAIFTCDLGLNMNKALKSGIGSVTPIDIKMSKVAAGSNQLKLGLELDTASKAYMDAILTANSTGILKLLVRMKYTFDATHALQIDFAGFAPSAPAFPADSDGVAQIALTLTPLYNETLATWLKISLTNAVAILP